jgi:hypothetical protein
VLISYVGLHDIPLLNRPNIIVSRRAHALRWLLVELVLAALMVFFPVLVALLSYAVSADQLTLHSRVIYRLVVQLTEVAAVYCLLLRVMCTLELVHARVRYTAM